ncbi:bifunctional hydroxymethylpyrimidine kinase/phosphomethylpyrimidine kinase [Actinomyces gerencseriae]|uniref:bifunctional hydroxymethylpyrimidine kinase/phosphomethylpyrimidine kinase n=1 Tax=Actinomyces gerencseriae TaxID=52769 RepID=UPI000406FD60|nr:bifunctional hydroxymethylpyrimidine kinase/phosphomethylpyrimidine kinase [Actinomyces gerencseriae]
MTRSEARSRTVTALTIAGSDPSGGAGVQADLKAMSALGAYGMSVITALTAQSTRGVTGVRAVPVDFVRLQLDTLLDDIVPDATKIGMLATAELADAVGEYLPGLSRTVLDPVMVATSGDRLLDEEAVGAVRRLCGVADLITPNLHEAAVLLGEEAAGDTGALRAQARRLVEQGAQRVLVKGGHFAAGTAGTADAPESVDVYADADSTVLLRGRRVMTKNTHGTGCTLSSAIASLRPRRATWLEAVRDAKVYLTGAIEHADALGVGHGHGPVHHFHRLWAQNDED